jgi:hypothetical protein
MSTISTHMETMIRTVSRTRTGTVMPVLYIGIRIIPIGIPATLIEDNVLPLPAV